MVPLWFLDQYDRDYRLVRSACPVCPWPYIMNWDSASEAAELMDRSIAVIGSGDLSHKLKEDGPYGFQKEGRSMTPGSWM